MLIKIPKSRIKEIISEEIDRARKNIHATMLEEGLADTVGGKGINWREFRPMAVRQKVADALNAANSSLNLPSMDGSAAANTALENAIKDKTGDEIRALMSGEAPGATGGSEAPPEEPAATPTPPDEEAQDLERDPGVPPGHANDRTLGGGERHMTRDGSAYLQEREFGFYTLSSPIPLGGSSDEPAGWLRVSEIAGDGNRADGRRRTDTVHKVQIKFSDKKALTWDNIARADVIRFKLKRAGAGGSKDWRGGAIPEAVTLARTALGLEEGSDTPAEQSRNPEAPPSGSSSGGGGGMGADDGGNPAG